ncbi:glycoside hydrolase [Neocallimastix lanati (nom. inval.)]|uniref:Glycoside hydrolase n=1 Tax=Neocallimastix californiae TaxID=1754190 RepID=A0A1Y2AJW6_9FUNG|nr:glycoside hydrolase [Neocallimastix sp. JGI-2020a]ORY22784.1 glycoside hydrolase [Neocallimastix californiae]|eukprot:ORY22784.1 glycoside hydrolase [Neocallimastix californiae]
MKMKFKILPLFFVLFKIIYADEEFHEFSLRRITIAKTTSKTSATKTGGLHATPKPGNAGDVDYLPYYSLYSKIYLVNFDFTGTYVVNYAFLHLDDKGVPFSSDTNLENSWKGVDLIPYLNNVVKKEYQHRRTIISIGGASGSSNFGKNLKKLLGNDKLLTLAAAGKPKKFHSYVKKLSVNINWINVITYNYVGSWNKYAGFNAPLYYTSGDKNDQYDGNQSIRAYINQGVPLSKLCLGCILW